MCLVVVVVRRYIHFLILLIPTPLVSALFGSSIPTFLFIFINVFRSFISCVLPYAIKTLSLSQSCGSGYSYIHIKRTSKM